jgi:hypothetical protein
MAASAPNTSFADTAAFNTPKVKRIASSNVVLENVKKGNAGRVSREQTN